MKKPIFLLAGLFYAYLGQAQQNFKTQSVSIFKNSTAFFIKSGEVRPNAEKIVPLQKNLNKKWQRIKALPL